MTERSAAKCNKRLLMRRSSRTFAVLILLVAGITTAAAAQPAREPAATEAPRGKRAWEWTLDERLTVRMDPTLIAQRQTQDKARVRAEDSESTPTQRHGVQNYSIDGSRNPELLLPHELFDSLMTAFVSDDERRNRQRDRLRPGILASGFDDEVFWAQLRSAASQYIDDHAYPVSESAAPGRGRDSLCRSAFIALQNARHVFGRDRFDRFLYEVIAPRTWVGSATNVPDPAAELRNVAGGCQ
jgi:hypothetical protein